MNIASVPSEVREQTLEAWLTEYGDAVLRMCYVYLGDRALAQDALQDTFIKAWRGMDGRRGESAVKTWILRIAINTCKDYRRTAWMRRVDRSQPIEELPLTFEDVSEESRALFDDVMNLPSKLKQVILLYHFQNLTLVETAEALHISRSAVQNRLQKAYTLLRFECEGGDTHEAK